MIEKKIEGAMLGSLFGDCIGAPFESGFLERAYWKVVGKTGDGLLRYTDDTEMSIALAEFCLWYEKGKFNQDALVCYFLECKSRHRGYGSRSIKALKRIRRSQSWCSHSQEVFSNNKFSSGSLTNNSYGNGSAMRSHIPALIYPDFDDVMSYTKLHSDVSHAHYQSTVCSRFIAAAVHMALDDSPNSDIIDRLESIYADTENQDDKDLVRSKLDKLKSYYQLSVDSNDVRSEHIQDLGVKPIAIHSVFTAILLALSYREKSFFDMMEQINSEGGDTDTVGSMAGAIWGAFNGSKSFIESDMLHKIEGVHHIRALSIEVAKKR